MPIVIAAGIWVLKGLGGLSLVALTRIGTSYLIRLLGIKALLGALWVAFWGTIVYFGKTVLVWFIDLAFYLLTEAMDALNFPDFMTSLLEAMEGLPELSLELIIMWGIFDTIRFWISCYFANRGLRIIPIVGRAIS